MENQSKEVKFNTITVDDWKRVFELVIENDIREQIKDKILQMHNQSPPEDLAGYQNIVEGTILKGDILVNKIDRHKVWAKSDDPYDIRDLKYHDIYRKIPVPHQGDLDHPLTDQVRTEIEGVAQIESLPFYDSEAETNDAGKPPMAKLPWSGVRAVSQVQAFGNKKYNDFFNYKKGMRVSRHCSCAIRHIAAYMDGEDNDPESGLNHLAHAACRLLFVLENMKDGTAIDDRYFKPRAKLNEN